MDNDWRCHVCVGNFVALDYGAEILQIEGWHYDCGDSTVSGKVDEALESCQSLSILHLQGYFGKLGTVDVVIWQNG